MNMILQSSIKDRILAAQKEAVDEFAGLQKGLDEMIEQRSDGTLYYLDQIWVPLKGEVESVVHQLWGLRLEKSLRGLQFSVGWDPWSCSRVSPLEGVVRFGKKGKLTPSRVIQLEFMEEPVEILEREFKKLKRSRIAIVKELTETDTIPSSLTPSSSSSKLFASNRLLSLLKPNPGCFKRYKSFFNELQGKYGYLFGHLTTRFMPRRKFNELARHLQDIMMESLPKMEDELIKKILQTQVPLHVAQGIILESEKSLGRIKELQ
ncbi:hypothetical protein Tco_0088442 [Tanacetum coccineum]